MVGLLYHSLLNASAWQATIGKRLMNARIVQDDYKKIQKLTGKYLFGHFELPHFYMNAMVEMPDHGEISTNHMTQFDQVYSGHFHKRQASKNIWYIGNAFPHNYADAGDDARGMMVLEWGKDPVFHTWPRQPVFRVHKLSEILEKPEGYLLIDSHVRVHLDVLTEVERHSVLGELLLDVLVEHEEKLLKVPVPVVYGNEVRVLHSGFCLIELAKRHEPHLVDAVLSIAVYDPVEYVLLKVRRQTSESVSRRHDGAVLEDIVY